MPVSNSMRGILVAMPSAGHLVSHDFQVGRNLEFVEQRPAHFGAVGVTLHAFAPQLYGPCHFALAGGIDDPFARG